MTSEIIRRQFILGGVSVGLAGCGASVNPMTVSSPIGQSRCGGISDALDRTLCRQAEIRESAATHVTFGVIVGAAIGFGVAAAIGANPAVGAIIGAGAGGIIAIAERYWSYRLEQANGEIARAVAEVRRDIADDTKKALEIIKAIQIARENALIAIANENRRLLDNYIKLQQTEKIARTARQNEEHISKTTTGYVHVAQKTPVGQDPEAVQQIVTLKSTAEQAHKESERFEETRKSDELTRKRLVER